MPALKPKVRTDLAVVEIEGEAVIYDARSGRLHHLNPTAAVIFQLCDGSGTIKELAAEIAEVTNLPQDEIARQVRRMVTSLRQAGMLDGKPPTPETHVHHRHAHDRPEEPVHG
jgi:PqqD family protein of HPr-rel-A system